MDEATSAALPPPVGDRTPPARLDVRVLGPVQVGQDGGTVRPGGPKQQVVLGLLVAAAGRSVSVDSLIDGVWGEDPPEAARSTLQSYVSNLRRVLGDVVVWEGHGYRLDVARECVDAWRFEDAVVAARELVDTDPSVAVDSLRDALRLWRGQPYAGVAACAQLEVEARRLEELRREAVEDRIDAELALGRHAELLGELEALIAETPLRERLRELHMLALYRSGRQADALQAYERARAFLVDELGIEPSPSLRDMQRRVLEQDPALEPETTARTERLALLFTELEEPPGRWETDAQAMAAVGELHDRIVREAVEAAGGRVTAATNGAIDAVFTDVGQAARAASTAQRALAEASHDEGDPLQVRMAVDVGELRRRADGYDGPAVDRLSRLVSAGHGGQVLLSADAQAGLDRPDGIATIDLGASQFRGVARPEQVYQLVADGLPARFPPLRADRHPRPRAVPIRTARSYELYGQLGEGDFGAVYRAYQTSVGREVAVKVIRSEYANRPAFVRRFEAEAQFVAQLAHPHIVAVYDYWREPDGAYLVMPLLAGGSLAAGLQRGPWNLGPALRLLDQVGAALSYAHRQGVVHRDVKPGNVLLDEDGNAYLSDFGIAARLTDDAGGLLTSSLAYVAPEELRGERLTPRSDVFALGVLVLELLAGIRPTGRDLPALTEARPGLPAELDEVVRTATDDDPARRFDRVEDLLRAIRQAAGADVVAVASPQPPVTAEAPIRNPYKGLRAFQETDAADFYGRDTLVDELLRALANHRLVAMVGASGSGKSSVVRAGLIPALRAGGLPGSRGWLVATMFPGSHPFEELETALLRVAVEDPGGLLDELSSDERGLLRVVKRILPRDDSELVLVIDQFEELFSLVHDGATRHLFLAALQALVTDERSRVRVLVTLRADFFDRPLEHPGFADLFKAALVAVTPPTTESLGSAISRPARSVGVDLEPGLVGEIIRDVQGQPGGLPLLQYALTELFRHRDGNRLTIDGYRDTGGVVGALGGRAEELYLGLPAPGKAAARQLFLRLVTVDEDTDDTRRRVSQLELEGLDVDRDHLDAVLQQYAAYRLLTYDRDPTSRVPTVEVAHEALLREWERLRGWIDDQREALVFHRRLGAAIRDWLDAGRDPSFLLRGSRLEQAEAWAANSDLVLSRQEEEFLAASRDLRAAEEAAARRRRRRLVASLLAALLVVSALALVALWQRQVADVETRAATARALAAAAVANLDVDPERSILLALEAVEATRAVDGTVLPEAEEALHRAVRTSRLVRTIPHGSYSVAVTSDGARVVTAGSQLTDNTVRVWDLATGEELLVLTGPDVGRPTGLVSPDDRLIVTVHNDMTTRLWDAVTGEELEVLEGVEGDVAFSPDGRWMALGGWFDTGITVWDLDAGTEVMTLEGHPDAERAMIHVAFHPEDSSGLVSLDENGRGNVWDLATGEPTITLEGLPGGGWVTFSPDGTRVAAATGEGVAVWDAETGDHLRTMFTNAPALPVAYNPDGTLIATGGSDSTAVVWDAETGRRLLTLAGHTAEVVAVTFTPDSERLVTSGLDDTTRVWDISVAGSSDWLTVPGPAGRWGMVAFHPDGTRFAVPADPTGVAIHDLDTGETLVTLDGHLAPLTSLAFSPDGSRLAGAGFWAAPAVETAPVWDIDTGELLFELSGHDEVVHVAFSPDGARLATAGGWDGTMRVWDAASGEEQLEIPAAEVWVGPVAFSPDGRLIAAVSVSEEFEGRSFRVESVLFEADTGERVGALEVDDGGTGLAFTPAGQLVMASFDGTARVWDVATDEVVWTLRHDTGLQQGAASPDGMRIAVATDDGTARLWDLGTGRQMLALHGHDAPVFGVAFSPDGRLLATSGLDGTVALHLLPLDEFVELASSRVTRSLTDDECRQYLDVDRCPDA